MTGIEPVSLAWKARVLPLHNTRDPRIIDRPHRDTQASRLTAVGGIGTEVRMIDARPVVQTIGRLTAVLGAMMAAPAIVDWRAGTPHWKAFAESGLICFTLGGLVAIATHRPGRPALTREQAFLLTAGLWLVLPMAGALPFMLGQPGANLTDALFEAMSGMTTTGTTVFPKLDALPDGTHLWRGILQWSGGLGIVVVAMIFLPAMRIGGMQFFRSEGFDTQGKVLPRAGEIAAEMTRIYVIITVACALTYAALGMDGLDAIIHAMTTCSTGGFSNGDASFGDYIGALEIAACVFMFLASIPFVRMVQALYGDVLPIWRDTPDSRLSQAAGRDDRDRLCLSRAVAWGRTIRATCCAKPRST